MSSYAALCKSLGYKYKYERFNGKTLILTSITDNKDQLLDPPQKFDNCDYIAFVDRNYDTKIWELRNVTNFSHIDKWFNRRNSRVYKILSSILFPEYEYIIWCDGNHLLKKDPRDIYREFMDFDLLLFKHPDRNCLYDEASVVVEWGLDDPINVDNQVSYYRNLGMPEKFGLFEVPSFIRKNSPLINKFDLMWWEQLCKFASRDQISLPFVLWELNSEINYKVLMGFANKFTLTGEQEDNDYFHDVGKHLK
jgi:hypothetical protein